MTDTTTRRGAVYTATAERLAPRMADFGDTRTITRYAWLPVLLMGQPWRRRRSWVFLARYDAVEVFAPDYGGWSTGLWVEVEARPLPAVMHA